MFLSLVSHRQVGLVHAHRKVRTPKIRGIGPRVGDRWGRKDSVRVALRDRVLLDIRPQYFLR